MKNAFKILILIFVFTSCKNEDKKTELVKKPVNEIINPPKLIVKTPLEIPKNVDDDFNTFLKHFNKDSIFQVSRVKFPLEISEFETDYFETIKRIIQIKDYQIIEISNSKINEYTIETIIKSIKVTIQIKGIENGIYIEFEFEKINGIWMLITWNDQST